MSKQYRFLGKWAILDTSAQALFPFGNVWSNTNLLNLYDDGTGANLCYCQMGPSPSAKSPTDLPYGAQINLQSALIDAVEGGDLQAGGANFPSVDPSNLQLQFAGLASQSDLLPPNADASCRFTYTDTSDPPLYSGQTLLVYLWPPLPFYGLFVPYIPGSNTTKIFGWSPASSNPVSSPYSVQVVVPSSQYMRQFLNNAAPSGTDYSYVDLSGEDYSNVTLQQANFECANLSNANFQGSDLSGASFKGANLRGVDFTGATLDGVDFTLATSIAGCRFTRAGLASANFNELDLTDLDFTGAHLHGTCFSNTDLTAATFSMPADFSPVQATANDFSYSTLDVKILGLNWSYFKLGFATLVNTTTPIAPLVAQSTILTGANGLNGTTFYDSNDGLGADFSNANLQQCDLAKCNLQLANFTGSQLQGDTTYTAAALTEANLENAVFTNANVTRTEFSGAFLAGATLTGATVVQTNFTGAYLVGVNFSDVAQNQCKGSNFDDACLINAVFNGTNASTYMGLATTFVRACLQGADFRDAKLDGANLASAGVAQVAGSFPVNQPGVPIPLPVTYATGTLGLQSATDGQCICPNTATGPCTPAKQTATDAPETWPSSPGTTQP